MIASNNILAFIGSYSMLYSSVLGASSPSALFSAHFYFNRSEVVDATAN